MKRTGFILLFLALTAGVFSQIPDTLTLEYCYQQVTRNYPLARQTGLLDKSSGLKISNLNKNYLPQVNLNASASLQSEVTEITIHLPAPFTSIAGPDISKDWYKLTFDVNQVIYDGSSTKWQKQLEKATLKADQKNVDAELYRLKDQVNQLFFSIFFNQQNEKLLNDNKKVVEARLKEMNAAVKYGTVIASAADALKVELLRMDQLISTNTTEREAAFKMLSELISVPLDSSMQLALPDIRLSSMNYENLRPEYQLFDLQQARLGALKSMVIVKWNPKFGAFGQVGYGRPGLNMLSNDFTPWWIFGARFTWNLWNWNENNNERQRIDIQSDIVLTQKETFDKNTRIASERDLSEIKKYAELLQQDEEIISLREKITTTTFAQMENGVVTSSEYIQRLNEELLAKISRELHMIQLVRAKQTYLYTLGKL